MRARCLSVVFCKRIKSLRSNKEPFRCISRKKINSPLKHSAFSSHPFLKNLFQFLKYMGGRSLHSVGISHGAFIHVHHPCEFKWSKVMQKCLISGLKSSCKHHLSHLNRYNLIDDRLLKSNMRMKM